VNPEPNADEADLVEQSQEVGEAEQPEVRPTMDVEANPADLHEQSQPVPTEEEDWHDA
jgi:hypothetical protein